MDNVDTSYRSLTLSEKILTHHAVGLKRPYVEPGEMICVKVQWTLACEITWKSMDKIYTDMGRPRIWRNDRFWLAVDHTVDPRVNHLPKQKMMIEASENFAKEANVINYQPPNTTIIHTEFYRQKACPGQIVVGADSHSCSSGGLGCFAIGLGAADVVMPLVTGETWIKVPETLRVEFINSPPFGIGGKDIMLYTLGQLKCNSVALGRCVEYTGNIEYLSCDARFAIANMTTEFGGIAGIFPADESTRSFIAQRQDNNVSNENSIYFRADANAKYCETFQIDLKNLKPQIAFHPSPDNVQTIDKICHDPQTNGIEFDGCFIGACTTTEEDLILAALVLEAGLKENWKIVPNKQRRVTPGSLTIIDKLKSLGLISIYEKAGFIIGVPGCSFCLGIAADVAKENEIWLSSQNRNYKNRMGKGSIGHLASAITVAASSFQMKFTDPMPLIQLIDRQRYQQMISFKKIISSSIPLPITIFPSFSLSIEENNPKLQQNDKKKNENNIEQLQVNEIHGKAIVFGDDIDTDAILPGEFLCENDVEKLGQVAFLHTHPSFRQQVKDGQNIVIGGRGFGCGSSREQAVTCLKGAGVQAVIAKSFGYIFSRNYQNFNLLGIQIIDENFYALAKNNVNISIYLKGRTIQVNHQHTFPFQMSLFEQKLLAGGGILPLYKKFGNRLFRVAIASSEQDEEGCCNKKKKNTSSQVDVEW